MSDPSLSLRRRLLGVLFASSALVRTGFIATITVASLVAEDLLDAATLAGLPAAMATIGVAVGTTPIAAVMRRYGRRIGIAGGHLWAALGAGTAAIAVNLEWFPLFIVGMFVFGFGNAGDRLSRYAAGDVAAAERRSFAISVVVWAGTIGSVAGPALLEPLEAAAESLGLEGLSGPPALAAVVLTAAAVLIGLALRPDPLTFVEVDLAHASRAPRIRPLLRLPAVRFAIVALIIGQVVMVLIMTMTPVHIRRAGEDLGIVGLVISAHTLGMFAVSPLTGLLADRIGRIPVMLMGQAILVLSAVMSATAAGDDRALLVTSLFLLGLGWNFGFVAGSAYLTESVPAAARVRLQGVADAVVWTSSAAASFSSGFLLEWSGYPVLSIIGGALVALPVLAFIRLRPTIEPAAS